MADPKATQPPVRTFEKVVDGEVKTRQVTSESAAVAARFDGYFEKETAKTTAAKPDSPRAANSAG